MKRTISTIALIGFCAFIFWNGMRFQRYLYLAPQIPDEEHLLEGITGRDSARITKAVNYDGTFYIEGEDAVRNFFELIEIDKDKLPKLNFFHIPKYLLFEHCMCNGEYRVTCGKVSFTIHHMKSIRWRGSNWGGDAPLTADSSEKLKNWFRDNGFDCIEPVAGGDATR